MATNKSRLSQLEKQTQQGTNKPTWKELVTIANHPEMYERSMNALAEVLGMTRADLDEGLKALKSE